MKLDYGTLLSSSHIKLSIGNLKKPKLQEIADISFSCFGFYELLTKLTPEQYYCIILGEQGKEIWKNATDEEKNSLTIYQLISMDVSLQDSYVEMLNFFFEEYVIFTENMFVLLNKEVNNVEEIKVDMVVGFVNEDNFSETMYLIQQVCCIANKKQEDISELKFKNEKARKMYEKMQKAEQDRNNKEEKKTNNNLSLPNVISAVATKHPSLNLTNIWDLTVFQLMDSFNRLQTNEIYEINSIRVSVWGNEKGTFDATLWYKNQNNN